MDQVLGESVGKILVGAVAEIGEGKYPDDCVPILRRQVGSAPRLPGAGIGPAWLPRPNVDRFLDVLETVTAGIDQRDAEMLAGLVIGLCRHGHAAGGGNRFQPHRDVDAVPEYFVFIGDHISHVDAETELHGPVRRQIVIPFRHQRLHRDRRFDGADDARELQQETVTGVLHHPAAVIENDRIDRASMRLESGVRTRLVEAHHARIAGDVSADYGR